MSPKGSDKTAKLRGDSVSAWQDWRVRRFPRLMQRRVEEILLVSSPYDAFSLEEDGLLTEVIYSEYVDLGLTHAPNVTRVSTGEEALEAIRGGRFDLVITMLRLGDMDVFRIQHGVAPGASRPANRAVDRQQLGVGARLRVARSDQCRWRLCLVRRHKNLPGDYQVSGGPLERRA
ncbi:MAG: hypothetical protein ABIG44_03790 [Planctomycetota bacterium]